MLNYGYEEDPAYSQALQRLAKVRLHELWLRTAIWVWFAAVIAWILPLGDWSAVHTAPSLAVKEGLCLSAIGATLLFYYRGINLISVMPPAEDRPTERRKGRSRLPRRRSAPP